MIGRTVRSAGAARRSRFDRILISIRKDASNRIGERLVLAAEQFEAPIRKAIIAAVNAAVDAADLQQLEQAIRSGDTDAIIAACGIDAFVAGLQEASDHVEDANRQSGRAVADDAPSMLPQGSIAVRFNALNPNNASAVQQQQFDLIKNVSDDTRQAIKSIVSRQVIAGQNPSVAAVQIKQIIGLTEQQAVALQNYRAALEGKEWSAARGYAIGGNASASIDTAEAKDEAGKPVPLSQEQIEALVESYRQRLIRMRAQTIARTESMKAASTGANSAWDQVVNGSGLDPNDFRRFWVSTNDNRTRPDHRQLPVINAQGVGMNEPFKLPDGTTIMRPHDPSAPAKQVIRCRCTMVVRYVPPGLNDALPVFAGRSLMQ